METEATREQVIPDLDNDKALRDYYASLSEDDLNSLPEARNFREWELQQWAQARLEWSRQPDPDDE